AVPVSRRERLALIDEQVVRRPVGGKRRGRRLLLRTHAHRLAAVAAILRRQHKLLLVVIVVAFRPAEIRATPQLDQFLRRLAGARDRLVKAREILSQLVAPVLCREYPPSGIEREALAIAQARRESFRRGEVLIQLVGVVAPGTTAGLQFRARLVAGYV